MNPRTRRFWQPEVRHHGQLSNGGYVWPAPHLHKVPSPVPRCMSVAYLDSISSDESFDGGEEASFVLLHPGYGSGRCDSALDLGVLSLGLGAARWWGRARLLRRFAHSQPHRPSRHIKDWHKNTCKCKKVSAAHIHTHTHTWLLVAATFKVWFYTKPFMFILLITLTKTWFHS